MSATDTPKERHAGGEVRRAVERIDAPVAAPFLPDRILRGPFHFLPEERHRLDLGEPHGERMLRGEVRLGDEAPVGFALGRDAAIARQDLVGCDRAHRLDDGGGKNPR
jgi:hypothetical protein